MAILALDYGTKRVGVAVSDPTLTLARPLPFLDAQPIAKLVTGLKALISQHAVERLVIGLPRNLDGSYGEAAQNARAFMAKLALSIPTPIETIDERLSTVQASRQLREAGRDSREQRSRIDSAAAAVLLQSYLDRQAMQNGGTRNGDELLPPPPELEH